MERQNHPKKQDKPAAATVHHRSTTPTPTHKFAPPYTPEKVIQLQRTIGNAAVQRLLVQQTAPQSIQRNIIVEGIDYDPDARNLNDGYINLRAFPAALEENLKTFYATVKTIQGSNDPYKDVRQAGRIQKVMAHVRKRCNIGDPPDYQAPDIPSLAQVIAADIQGAYTTAGVQGGWSITLRNGIKSAVQDALLSNLAPGYRAMVHTEAVAFKKLINKVGRDASRSKGTPTPITMAQIGEVDGLRGAVAGMRTNLLAAQNAMTMTRPTYRFEWENLQLLNTHFSGVIDANGEHYQGNHTNNAGWLPTQTLPANGLVTLSNAIRAHGAVTPVPGLVQALTANATAQAQVDANPVWNVPYTLAFNALAVAPAYSDAVLRRMAWLSLGEAVSSYIEFSIPGHGQDISRLIYDFVGNNFYVTAHYKWNEGYNPFFHITDLHL